MQCDERATGRSASGTRYAENPANLINLSRYPLNRLGSPEGARLVADCHERMKATGVCLLKNFINGAALDRIVSEAWNAEPDACTARITHNAYMEPDDDAFPPDHPRRYRLETSAGHVAEDRLSVGSAIRGLYLWDPLVSFMGAIFGDRGVIRSADSRGPFYVSVLRHRDRQAWRFSEADYTASLMLQAPQEGGEFEFVPVNGSNGDSQYALVGRILRDEYNAVKRVPVVPGDLLVFSGRGLIHRVTEVRGETPRLATVFCFGSRASKTSTGAADRVIQDPAR